MKHSAWRRCPHVRIRGIYYDEEKLIALLNSAQHAPPSTHSPVDGSCQECPWPLYTLSPEEIAAAFVAALRGGELTREETNE